MLGLGRRRKAAGPLLLNYPVDDAPGAGRSASGGKALLPKLQSFQAVQIDSGVKRPSLSPLDCSTPAILQTPIPSQPGEAAEHIQHMQQIKPDQRGLELAEVGPMKNI